MHVGVSVICLSVRMRISKTIALIDLIFYTRSIIRRGRPWRYSVIPSTPDFTTEYQIRRDSNPAGLPTFAAIWGPAFRASIIRLTCPHVFKQIKKIELL